MKTLDEIRDAMATLSEFCRRGHFGELGRETQVQLVGMMTALEWVAGEVLRPGVGADYVNPVPQMLTAIRERMRVERPLSR